MPDVRNFCHDCRLRSQLSRQSGLLEIGQMAPRWMLQLSAVVIWAAFAGAADGLAQSLPIAAVTPNDSSSTVGGSPLDGSPSSTSPTQPDRPAQDKPQIPAGSTGAAAPPVGFPGGSTVATTAQGELVPPGVRVREYGFGEEDDADFDGQPDDWLRRKGPGFPAFVQSVIDPDEGAAAPGSLRIDANGGAAAYYSAPLVVDPDHSYVVTVKLKTAGLAKSAGLVSLSFLDAQRRRVQRHISRPLSATSNGWVTVQIGPVSGSADVKFAVIGCHLIVSDQADIRGTVWFDDLRLGQLPRLELATNFHSHFVQESAPVETRSQITGFRPNVAYAVRLDLLDIDQQVVETAEQELHDLDLAQSGNQLVVPWTLPRQRVGYYHVRVRVHASDEEQITRSTSFAVMDLLSQPRKLGEFAWSLPAGELPLANRELVDICSQAGINWVKQPLWSPAANGEWDRAGKLTELLDGLGARHIQAIGMLSDPPARVRSKFAANWAGISEIWSLPADFWRPSLQPVLARFSSHVRYWQIAGDNDTSFADVRDIGALLDHVHEEIRQIGQGAEFAVPWTGRRPIAGLEATRRVITAIPGDPGEAGMEWKATRPANVAAQANYWVNLPVDESASETPANQAALLVRRMVAAKIHGAELISTNQLFCDGCSLLNRDGSPGSLFLPWRTAALHLQQAQYLGSLQMAGGSENALFSRDGQATLVIWNPTPREERSYFGPAAYVRDIWGRRFPLRDDPQNQEQVVSVGPSPIFLCNCSEAVLRWRIAVQYEIGQSKSEYGAHPDAVLGVNSFKQGISGSAALILPRDWVAEPKEWPLQLGPGQRWRLPFALTLPPYASLGTEPTYVEFRLQAEQPYRFRVMLPYRIGQDDVGLKVQEKQLEDGRWQIEQIISNRTNPPETLSFRATLFVPGMQRQKVLITKLMPGAEDRRLFYLTPGAAVMGQELRLRLEQDGGRRLINFRWNTGEHLHREDDVP